MNWPVISANPQVQAFYELCREKGESHNMAGIFAERRPPGLQTDTSYLAQRQRHPFSGNDDMMRHARAKAAAVGISIEGKDYEPQLAHEPLDPHAWVEGRSDIRRKCQLEGLGCEGAVHVERAPSGSPEPYEKPYRVADDIVDAAVCERLEETRERPTVKQRKALKSEIRKEITPDL